MSARQLGYYAVAATYAFLALVVALAPAWHFFSQASKHGYVTREPFRWLQRRTTVAMIIVAVFGGLCAPIFMTVVFGRAFSPAIIPAIVLLAGGPPLALSALRAAAWKASGRPLPAALAEGIGMLVTVVGLAVFAPRFGIIAAAYTSVVAYGTVTCALFWLRTAPVVRVAPDVGSSEPYQGRPNVDSNVLDAMRMEDGEHLGYYPDPVGFQCAARVTPWPASVRWEHRTPALDYTSDSCRGAQAHPTGKGDRQAFSYRVEPSFDVAEWSELHQKLTWRVPVNSLPARKSGRRALKDSI